MEKEELLKKKIEISADIESTLVNQIKNVLDINGALRKISFFTFEKSIYSFFINSNLQLTKQEFYIIGGLTENLVNKYDSDILEWSNIHKCAPLLSDNESLIQRFANLKNSNFVTSKKDIGVVTNAIQNCIKNDDKALKEDIIVLEKMEEKSKGEEKRYYEMSKLFFTAYLNNDKQAITQSLKDSLAYKTKNAKKYSDLVSQFIATPEIGYAKLAWRKGMEIDLNHTLVPQELLPVKPNAEYFDTYDFLINY